MKIITYLDILGFSAYIQENEEYTIELLQNYSLQISYLKDLKEKSFKTFDYFVPMSDSIFITSSNFSEHIFALSEFLLNCFQYSSSNFNTESHKDGTDPRETIQSELKLENGIVNTYPTKIKVFPLLFRGGISNGDFKSYSTLSIKKNLLDKSSQTNFIGKGVVEVVKLEQIDLKGPRIFLNKSIVKNTKKRKKYLASVPNNKDLYELLWPMAYLEKTISTEDDLISESQILNYFLDLYLPSYSLWNFFKGNLRLSAHYLGLLLLLEKSLHVFANDSN